MSILCCTYIQKQLLPFLIRIAVSHEEEGIEALQEVVVFFHDSFLQGMVEDITGWQLNIGLSRLGAVIHRLDDVMLIHVDRQLHADITVCRIQDDVVLGITLEL